jgi:hypothetical protein
MSMSKASANRIHKRIEQLEQDLNWATSILDDPDQQLAQYDLTPEECEEVLTTLRAALNAIGSNVSQALYGKIKVQINSGQIKLTKGRLIEIANGRVTQATKNMLRSDVEKPGIGPIPPWLSLGPISPWPPGGRTIPAAKFTGRRTTKR